MSRSSAPPTARNGSRSSSKIAGASPPVSRCSTSSIRTNGSDFALHRRREGGTILKTKRRAGHEQHIGRSAQDRRLSRSCLLRRRDPSARRTSARRDRRYIGRRGQGTERRTARTALGTAIPLYVHGS